MPISGRWPAGRHATRYGSFHAAGLDLVCKFWNPSALMTPLLKSGIAAPCHVYAFECCGALIPETVGTAPRVDRSKRRDPTRLSTAVSLRLRVACFVPRILAARAMLPRSEINSAKLRGSGLRRIFASSEPTYSSVRDLGYRNLTCTTDGVTQYSKHGSRRQDTRPQDVGGDPAHCGRASTRLRQTIVRRAELNETPHGGDDLGENLEGILGDVEATQALEAAEQIWKLRQPVKSCADVLEIVDILAADKPLLRGNFDHPEPANGAIIAIMTFGATTLCSPASGRTIRALSLCASVRGLRQVSRNAVPHAATTSARRRIRGWPHDGAAHAVLR